MGKCSKSGEGLAGKGQRAEGRGQEGSSVSGLKGWAAYGTIGSAGAIAAIVLNLITANSLQSSEPSVFDHNLQIAQAQPRAAGQDVLFRTKHYVVQLYWRGTQPYMTVSSNGFRVIVNQRAQVVSPRSPSDDWATYVSNAGDYQAYVRVAANGQGMIEVALNQRTIAREYAQFASAARSPRQGTTPDSTLLGFQTHRYAVKVYEQQGKLYLNLYDRQSNQTELKQVPVKAIALSEAMVYQYDGDSTVQVRESSRGTRSLLILRDNEVKYRSEGY